MLLYNSGVYSLKCVWFNQKHFKGQHIFSLWYDEADQIPVEVGGQLAVEVHQLEVGGQLVVEVHQLEVGDQLVVVLHQVEVGGQLVVVLHQHPALGLDAAPAARPLSKKLTQ